MRANLVVRERKKLLDGGSWKTGKMPRTAFPLSKSHSYSLGSTWRWRVLTLEATGRRYRLLVAYEESKEQYQAWLGYESGGDQALLARLEYHPSHRGWHCHVKTGELEKVSCGVVKVSGEREKARLCSPDADGKVTDLDALSIACRVFNVDSLNDGLFQ